MSGAETLTPVPVGSAEYSEVLTWLYREARLLDAGEFDSWLELMAPDIAYHMPTRISVLPKEGSGFHSEFGLFAENHASLTARVKRLGTSQAWAEQPRSRTRHYLTNVLIDKDAAGGLHVTASMLVTRSRANRPSDMFCGERQDLLRRRDGTLMLARRCILLDHTVLDSHNLSIFF